MHVLPIFHKTRKPEKPVPEEILCTAGDTGNSAMVEKMLRSGANPNCRGGIKRATPLLYASWRGHIRAAQALLAGGAKVDEPNEDGLTPLMAAAMNGHAELVRLLLRQGANPNAQTKGERQTALMLAVIAKQGAAFQSLLDVRADALLSDSRGETALEIANRFDNREAAARLAAAHPELCRPRRDWACAIRQRAEARAREFFPMFLPMVHMIGIEPGSALKGRDLAAAEAFIRSLEEKAGLEEIRFRTVVNFLEGPGGTFSFAKHADLRGSEFSGFFWPPHEDWPLTPIIYINGHLASAAIPQEGSA